MRKTPLVWLTVLLTSSLLGCDDKPAPAADAGSDDAGARPALGGKLGQAVKAAESASPSASPAAGDGPPARGIFAPGAAPIAEKAPPKVELFDDGSDPKIALHAAAYDAEQKLPLTLVLTQGRQAVLPPMELDLVIGAKGADKAGDDKTGAASSASAPPAPPSANARYVVRIADARLPGAEGYPKELAELPKKLKGGAVEFSLTKSGPVEFTRLLAKDADKDLDLPLRIIEEALNGLYVPAPDKPVGEGAYWMVSDRHPSLGVDVVRYRVFRVSKIDGDRAAITIETRQYAASEAFDLPLGAQMTGMKLAQYTVSGKGLADVVPKSIFPPAAGFGLRTEAALATSAAQGGKQAMLALEITAQLGKEPPSGAVDPGAGNPGGGNPGGGNVGGGSAPPGNRAPGRQPPPQ